MEYSDPTVVGMDARRGHMFGFLQWRGLWWSPDQRLPLKLDKKDELRYASAELSTCTARAFTPRRIWRNPIPCGPLQLQWPFFLFLLSLSISLLLISLYLLHLFYVLRSNISSLLAVFGKKEPSTPSTPISC